jgi:hypothetical protein
MKALISAITAAILLVGCGTDEIDPEVANRIANLDDRADAVAVEMGHHTATMALAVDDIYTLELEEASYRTTSRHAIADLFDAISDLYACAGGAETDGLDAVTHLTSGIWFEVNKHRMIMADMDEMSGVVLEERRHADAVAAQLDGIFELFVVIDDEAVHYHCR